MSILKHAFIQCVEEALTKPDIAEGTGVHTSSALDLLEELSVISSNRELCDIEDAHSEVDDVDVINV